MTDETYSLPSQTMGIIAKYIEELFPTENKETYFPVTHNKSRKTYSGKLYDRYKNHRGTLNNFIKTHAQVFEQKTATVVTEDEKRMSAWLNNNIEPWETVEKYWKCTSANRAKRNQTDGTIKSIVQDFPALRGGNGHLLVSNSLLRI